ncbi:MAG: Crp/Fnr family transcriptional regulator [Ruthenibacterium lactatiformans]
MKKWKKIAQSWRCSLLRPSDADAAAAKPSGAPQLFKGGTAAGRVRGAGAGRVLCGQIEAEKQTADGVTLTLTRMGPGGIFADILAGSRGAKSPVTVTAATDVTVLLIPYKSLLRSGVPLDAAHAAVLQNLVAAMADKYFALDRRVELLMLHSLREKVLHYLRTEALPAPGGAVRTPYTRAGLAAYLGCERSALSGLSRMRRDGILQIDRRVSASAGRSPVKAGPCGQTGGDGM